MNSIVNEYESIWNRAHNQKEASNKILAWLLATSDLPPKHTMEAFDIALKALRPVSREQVEKVLNEWEPCEFCGEWIGGDCTPRERDIAYKIYAGYTKQVAVDDFVEDEIENLNFCPVCGRPMTDEAVEMLTERLEAMKDVR